MSGDYTERNRAGLESEQHVRAELEQRCWKVEKYGREIFSAGLNRVLTDWRDDKSRPCALGWNPDFVVWTPENRRPSNLYLVDVKRFGTGFHIARRALDTYVTYENAFNIPVVIVFHVGDELLAIAADKAAQNANPRHGNPQSGSGQPLYVVDANHMSPMERFFGAKKL